MIINGSMIFSAWCDKQSVDNVDSVQVTILELVDFFIHGSTHVKSTDGFHSPNLAQSIFFLETDMPNFSYLGQASIGEAFVG